MNWTTENTLVALGYVLLIGGLLLLVWRLERKTRLLAQVDIVRRRLVQPPPQPIYKTIVQLDSNGGLASFNCRVPLSVGSMVTADIRGELAPPGVNSRILGVVVSQTLELPNEVQ